jgi:hypothetical protein
LNWQDETENKQRMSSNVCYRPLELANVSNTILLYRLVTNVFPC